jgi:hypothetical protein
MNGFAEEKDLILFLASLESFIKSDDAGGEVFAFIMQLELRGVQMPSSSCHVL